MTHGAIHDRLYNQWDPQTAGPFVPAVFLSPRDGRRDPTDNE